MEIIKLQRSKKWETFEAFKTKPKKVCSDAVFGMFANTSHHSCKKKLVGKEKICSEMKKSAERKTSLEFHHRESISDRSCFRLHFWARFVFLFATSNGIIRIDVFVSNKQWNDIFWHSASREEIWISFSFPFGFKRASHRVRRSWLRGHEFDRKRRWKTLLGDGGSPRLISLCNLSIIGPTLNLSCWISRCDKLSPQLFSGWI